VSASYAGRLLVATPVLTEPTFDRTVILLIAHEEDGAFGVVINRVSDVSLGVTLPEWAALATEPASVFRGGPVADDAAICLARMRGGEPPGWTALDGGRLGTLDLATSAAQMKPYVSELRVFAGYAGWGAGQVDAEIAMNAWVIADTSPEDVFTDQPASLWSRVLRRQNGLIAAMANYPPDPALN